MGSFFVPFTTLPSLPSGNIGWLPIRKEARVSKAMTRSHLCHKIVRLLEPSLGVPSYLRFIFKVKYLQLTHTRLRYCMIYLLAL